MFAPHESTCHAHSGNACTCGAAETDSQLIQIGRRYAALQSDAGIEPDSPHLIARRVYESHVTHEALRLDMLASPSIARDSDFAHDISGILRGDVFQSARFAACYHARNVTPQKVQA